MTDPQDSIAGKGSEQNDSGNADTEAGTERKAETPDGDPVDDSENSSPRHSPDNHPEERTSDTGAPADNVGENVPEAEARPDSAQGAENGALNEAEGSEPSADEKPMSLLEHLSELRRRICFALLGVLAGFLLCYGFSEYLFNWLCEPLIKAMPDASHLIYTGVAEGFLTHVKIALVAGIFIGSPFIFYQFWAFVAPGLYEEERRYIIPIALCSALFFICGAAFGYVLVFPMAFKFFMSYNTEYVVAMPKLSEYLDFSLQMLVAFGVVFEMPLVAFFLGRMGILTVKLMRRIRRYAILGIFIVAAVLTPPDVASQLCMAAPLLILYEFSILVVKIFGKHREAPQAEEKEQKEATPPLQGD